MATFPSTTNCSVSQWRALTQLSLLWVSTSFFHSLCVCGIYIYVAHTYVWRPEVDTEFLLQQFSSFLPDFQDKIFPWNLESTGLAGLAVRPWVPASLCQGCINLPHGDLNSGPELSQRFLSPASKIFPNYSYHSGHNIPKNF